jgi:hypothetical protein
MPALLPDAPGYVLAAVPFIVLAAYTVFGATGFGSSIVAVPALAHFFPLTFAVPLFTALDGVATANASWRQWRDADLGEFRRLVPAMIAGIAAGTTLLVNLPRAPALLALGVFVIAYGVDQLAGRREWRALRPAWAWPLGIAGGAFSVLFGSGGPIYMIYLSARVPDKTRLRATSSVVVTLSVFIRIVVFAATGLLLHAPLLMAAAALLPFMLGGYALGNRLHHTMSRAGVLRLIATLLIANGVLLVVRAGTLLAHP